jgi:hypothetical protein
VCARVCVCVGGGGRSWVRGGRIVLLGWIHKGACVRRGNQVGGRAGHPGGWSGFCHICAPTWLAHAL